MAKQEIVIDNLLVLHNNMAAELEATGIDKFKVEELAWQLVHQALEYHHNAVEVIIRERKNICN